MKIQDILEIKATLVEVAKDSPLLVYVTFYEPLHNWVSAMAEGWNPFAKLVLNVVMAVYGILRIAAIIKSWNKEDSKSGAGDDGVD
jgi:hypothetical protein